MVEEAVSKCFECQISTIEHKQEPVKPSDIPETAWHTLSVDFGGPYPDSHHNLVIIDKQTRYPVFEQFTSTSCKVTGDRLRKVFTNHRIPERLDSYNGPPFNSFDLETLPVKWVLSTTELPQSPHGQMERQKGL